MLIARGRICADYGARFGFFETSDSDSCALVSLTFCGMRCYLFSWIGNFPWGYNLCICILYFMYLFMNWNVFVLRRLCGSAIWPRCISEARIKSQPVAEFSTWKYDDDDDDDDDDVFVVCHHLWCWRWCLSSTIGQLSNAHQTYSYS